VPALFSEAPTAVHAFVKSVDVHDTPNSALGTTAGFGVGWIAHGSAGLPPNAGLGRADGTNLPVPPGRPPSGRQTLSSAHPPPGTTPPCVPSAGTSTDRADSLAAAAGAGTTASTATSGNNQAPATRKDLTRGPRASQRLSRKITNKRPIANPSCCKGWSNPTSQCTIYQSDNGEAFWASSKALQPGQRDAIRDAPAPTSGNLPRHPRLALAQPQQEQPQERHRACDFRSEPEATTAGARVVGLIETEGSARCCRSLNEPAASRSPSGRDRRSPRLRKARAGRRR
jgi:hypothetical protein